MDRISSFDVEIAFVAGVGKLVRGRFECCLIEAQPGFILFSGVCDRKGEEASFVDQMNGLSEELQNSKHISWYPTTDGRFGLDIEALQLFKMVAYPIENA